MIRFLLAAAVVAWAVAAAVLVGGGIDFRFAGVLIRAHSALPALVIALLATTALWASGFRLKAEGRRPFADALTWWWTFGSRRARWIAAALSLVTLAIGLNWGTFVVGGSDSYCYINQAELYARGDVHDVEPMATDATWPGDPVAFVPAGHSLVPASPGALAPICPAGYPVVVAAARVIGGRTAMFWVTPLAGALAVWLTFLLGRQISGTTAGLFAALLLATSPIFIYQLVQPMNDILATALWCAVLVTVVCRPNWVVLAGLLTGVALTIRPNLLPVGVLVGVWMLSRGFTRGLVFGLACIPGLVLVLVAQNAMYGSPFRSGYGDLSPLFSASHILPNLTRYPRWLIAVHTPVLVLALIAVWLPPSRLRQGYGGQVGGRNTKAWLLAFIAAVFACYLPYVVFEEWWYQRFVLPALPVLFVLTAAVIASLLARLAVPLRATVFVLLCAAFAILYLHTGVRRDAFRLHDLEYRFRAAGEFVAARLPANAAIITVSQSGSVRYYAGRSTATWDLIAPGRLADALTFLRRHGRDPYLLFESTEEKPFRARFAATDPLGALDWPARYDIDRRVRIYHPDDRDRYQRGEPLITERVITRRR